MSSLAENLKKAEELMKYQGDDRIVSSDELREELANLKMPEVHFMSMIESLDSYIDGFVGGELIVISGPTKNGKTTFAQSLTKNFQTQGVKSLWFSFEVPARQLLKDFAKSSFFMPHSLVDRRMDWLENRILEAKFKYDVKAVFIDHLHYLIDIARANSPSLEIGSVIRSLKSLAIQQNIVIFLLAHTTKTKFDAPPSEGDVRDSSFIPQEADSTLMIWRKKVKNRATKEMESTGETTLLISNHRRTGVMAKKIELVYDNGILYEKTRAY